MHQAKKSFVIVSLGTLIEYYDYALLAIFLPIMAPVFFATDSHYAALVKGYWVLLIAMLARPIGGLAFGYIGDRLGRRVALMISIIGIACTTLAIGLLPGYATLGIWAVILLTLCKAIQLFCFGGEYNGAGIYVIEKTRENKGKALQGSLLTAMTLGGGLLATLIGVILTHPGMPKNAWRMAYVIGAAIGFAAIFYRRSLTESPEFQSANLKIHTLSFLIKQYPRELLACFFVGGFSTLSFTTILTFINPVLMTTGYFTSHQMMWLQTLLVIVAIIALIISGHFADRYSPSLIMQYGAFLLVVLACPLLWLISTKIITLLIASQILLILCNEMLLGPSNAYLTSCFPAEYRYRAVSLSFCTGMCFVGGLSPIIENKLFHDFGSFTAAGMWVSLISLLTALSLKNLQRKPFQQHATNAP
ncbi:MAG: MFS transporter [Gammaproteobacteria bacterium]|nr:MFS transporter [Gammaproteobacteria bacterium]MCH9743995.1 MFS transporter [Gammaproteobacteria bacterium]